MVEKLFPETELISGPKAYNFIQSVFIVREVEGYQNMLELSCRLLAFTAYESFLKNKKRSGTSLLTFSE